MLSRSPALSTLAALAQQTSAAPINARAANHLLHGLYVAAAVLALVLTLVIALAVAIWRRNKSAEIAGDPRSETRADSTS